MVVINRGTKHCPVDTRDDVLYSLSGRTRAEIHILKYDRKDVLSVVVCCVELTLAVVGVYVLVGDDSYDTLTVLQALTDGAVPVTPSAYVLRIQPYSQPIVHTSGIYDRMRPQC